ncbi:hypothetical protein T07_5483 [Trichinella nelsoni]|uniref:Uncharacterized protein n=1 Tax=Trichinella nelsoni TaxID=6336 RepID=A0A0V0RB09_9BILA|nr:hypothetical protein T07_5483 [Trichinella nelsoni]
MFFQKNGRHRDTVRPRGLEDTSSGLPPIRSTRKTRRGKKGVDWVNLSIKHNAAHLTFTHVLTDGEVDTIQSLPRETRL